MLWLSLKQSWSISWSFLLNIVVVNFNEVRDQHCFYATSEHLAHIIVMALNNCPTGQVVRCGNTNKADY
jgi:hypothetical protein